LGRGEVDIGMIWVVKSTAFGVRVVRDIKFGDRACEVAVECGNEQDQSDGDEYDETDGVSVFSLLV